MNEIIYGTRLRRNPIGESTYNEFKIMTKWHVKYFQQHCQQNTHTHTSFIDFQKRHVFCLGDRLWLSVKSCKHAGTDTYLRRHRYSHKNTSQIGFSQSVRRALDHMTAKLGQTRSAVALLPMCSIYLTSIGRKYFRPTLESWY